MPFGCELLRPALAVLSRAAFNAAVAPNQHIIVCDDAHRTVEIMSGKCPVVLGP